MFFTVLFVSSSNFCLEQECITV